ncbi:MAG: ABC transporter permease subunit [Firmicutes bacterium]|nr:ABC transporter permease subunit [Bacillota bacterium]
MEDFEAISLGKRQKNRLWQKLYDQRYLFLMSLPFVFWVILFRYVPIWGWTMAFQDYKPYLSFGEQQWVGLLHFSNVFKDANFYLAMRNTLVMSFLSLATGFTFPIAFALFLNEIRGKIFKRTIQTISYLPHFVSWVIVASMFSKLLGISGGVNQALMALGIIDKPVLWLSKGEYFWGLVTAIDLWKEIGWNSILYLAAMMGIDDELHEAAAIDGAGRFRRMWHITLPGIRPVIGILMIMSIGNLINIGFEKQFLLKTPLTIDYAQVLDLYILHYGIEISQYAWGTAVGIFKSVVSILLLVIANRFIKRFGEGSTVL